MADFMSRVDETRKGWLTPARDIILGQDFQKEHKSVIIEYGGSKPELMIPKSTPVCALSAASVEEPSLFANLRPDCKPIQQEVYQLYTTGG
jgi:hypothetical protein